MSCAKSRSHTLNVQGRDTFRRRQFVPPRRLMQRHAFVSISPLRRRRSCDKAALQSHSTAGGLASEHPPKGCGTPVCYTARHVCAALNTYTHQFLILNANTVTCKHVFHSDGGAVCCSAPGPGGRPSVCLHKSTSGAGVACGAGEPDCGAAMWQSEDKKNKINNEKPSAGCWPIEPNLCAPSATSNEERGSGAMFTREPQLISLGTDEQRGRQLHKESI